MSWSLVRTTLAVAGLVFAASLVPTTVMAQQASAVSGPRIQQAGVSTAPATSATADHVPQQERSMGNGWNVAMMVVGGTALIVGPSVGGDGGQIIAVAGAVIGLIGMFRYLR